MEYEVVQDYYSAEFDFVLYPGDVLLDGDIEPDLMAQLAASGVIEAVGADDAPVVEVEPEPEDAAE